MGDYHDDSCECIACCHGWSDDGEPELECDHDNYEHDILTGECHCNMCSYRWIATKEQTENEIERIREYSEWEAENIQNHQPK